MGWRFVTGRDDPQTRQEKQAKQLAVPYSLLLWAKVFNRTHFIESISGVFPHLERRKYAYIMSVPASTLLLRSIFPFEQELRTARVLWKAFLGFFHIMNIHIQYISYLFLPAHSCYIGYSLSNMYKNWNRRRFILRKHFWCSVPHLEQRLGYLKDSNAGAYFVDSNVFLRSDPSTTSCMMTHRCRGVTGDCNEKAEWFEPCLDMNNTHQPLLYQIAKTKRCGNCRSRNRTHKFCTVTH